MATQDPRIAQREAEGLVLGLKPLFFGSWDPCSWWMVLSEPTLYWCSEMGKFGGLKRRQWHYWVSEVGDSEGKRAA